MTKRAKPCEYRICGATGCTYPAMPGYDGCNNHSQARFAPPPRPIFALSTASVDYSTLGERDLGRFV